MTIAGSDSSGGAGIQADLKTFQAFGVYGTSAITAITAQNTTGVRAVHALPVEIVRSQIRAVVEDLPVRAAKSGMLATRQLVRVVAEEIRKAEITNYVLDPVMVATSGDRLLDDNAVIAITSSLLPLCALVTPNLDEARILTGRELHTEDDMRAAAHDLVERGARAALVKGGHLSGDVAVDVMYDGGNFSRWERPRVNSTNTHGTGCTLSAAIVAGLARGWDLQKAVATALEFVHAAIVSAPGLGHGHGPLNHFTSMPSSAAK